MVSNGDWFRRENEEENRIQLAQENSVYTTLLFKRKCKHILQNFERAYTGGKFRNQIRQNANSLRSINIYTVYPFIQRFQILKKEVIQVQQHECLQAKQTRLFFKVTLVQYSKDFNQVKIKCRKQSHQCCILFFTASNS